MTVVEIHRGMGDAIVCNALLREMASLGRIRVPVWSHYHRSIRFMFRDEPNIEVFDLAFEHLQSKHWPVIHIGDNGREVEETQWDRKFYKQAGMPFEWRWDRFRLDRDPKIEFEIPHQPYAFVHDSASSGAQDIKPEEIGGIRIYRPLGYVENMFSFMRVIENAAEIHCINSCFLNLIDSLDYPNVPLYFWKSKRATAPPILRRPWIVR